jgi:uncharacterized protein YjbJ (UPF0337 family)
MAGQLVCTEGTPGRPATARPPAADQIGYPVSRRERRVHPLDHRDTWPAEAGHPDRDRRQPRAQPGYQRRGPLGHSGPLPDRRDRVQHLVQRVRIQGQYVRLAAQVLQRVAHLPGRQRAHPAQVLGQDQVGRQFSQRPRVQRVEILTRGQPGPDVPVDVTRGHGLGIQAADHDRLLGSGGGRLIALEGDPGQVIAQAERVDDLRRRRQQRDQAHRSRLIRRRRGSRSSSHDGGDDMGFIDKMRNKFKMGKGRAKQDVGRATGDPYLETKGQSERAEGAARQVGEQVKDAAKNVRDAFK